MGRSRTIRPTLEQKKQIEAAGLNCKDWLVLAKSEDLLLLVHRSTGESRRIKKEPHGGNRGSS